MIEHDTVLDYLRKHYGLRNVVPLDGNTAIVRMRGRETTVDLATFVPLQTHKDDDARSHA